MNRSDGGAVETTCASADGDAISDTEKLAIQLWYTWLTKSGRIYKTLDWLKTDNAVAIAAMGWMRIEPHEKDAWLAVATKARVLVGEISEQS